MLQRRDGGRSPEYKDYKRDYSSPGQVDAYFLLPITKQHNHFGVENLWSIVNDFKNG